MNYATKTAVTVPSAYVTKNKQRIKQYDNTIYLKNGDEFEIELYNPTQNKVLAKIEINGNSIGGTGIILRPGERVFLERYLNEAKKFLFETYKVSGNNQEVKKAIEHNGDISVKFFQEYISPSVNYGNPIILNNGWYDNLRYYGSNTGGSYSTISTNSLGSTSAYCNTLGTTSFNGGTTTNAFFSHSSTPTSGSLTSGSVTTDSLSFETRKELIKKMKRSVSKEIETGRVEKGSNSDQSFTYDYTTFNSWHTWKSDWKLLPISQKALVKEDLKVFCGECGTKRKKDSHKFCPHCGTKY